MLKGVGQELKSDQDSVSIALQFFLNTVFLFYNCQYIFNFRPITRTSADMVNSDFSFRVDKNITTALVNIIMGAFRHISSRYF